MIQSKHKYEIADIVYVEENERGGHFFIIIDDNGEAVPAEYMSLITSTNTSKTNKNNKRYPFNEELKPSSKTGLNRESHVKCDQLIIVDAKNIMYKVGEVPASDFKRFINAYAQYLESINNIEVN